MLKPPALHPSAWIRGVLFSVGTLAAASCKTMARLEPVAHLGQDVSYERGVGTTVSRAQGSVVRVEPQPSPYERGSQLFFTLHVENLADSAIEISEQCVVAEVQETTARVVTAEEQVLSAQSRARKARIANAFSDLASSGDSAQAATKTTSGTSQTVAHDNTGWMYAETEYVQETYDPDTARRAQAEAADRSQKQLAGIAEREQREIQWVRSKTLQRTTLEPGEYVSGVVLVETARRSSGVCTICLRVRVGEDVHELWFNETRMP